MHVVGGYPQNSDVADFLDSPYNRVADVKMLYFFERISPFALKVVIGLGVASVAIPYFWCRYLCPYGALLGFVSLFSPLKVTRDAAFCIACLVASSVSPTSPRSTISQPMALSSPYRV